MKKKRLLSLLLCIALLLPLAPVLPVRTASAAAGETAIQLDTGGIDVYDTVYFAKLALGNSPATPDIPWVVLPTGSLTESTPDTTVPNTMPLLSKNLLGEVKFATSEGPVTKYGYDYFSSDGLRKSDLYNALLAESATDNSIYADGFSEKEKTAVVDTTLTKGSINSESLSQPIAGQKLFPLSHIEAQALPSNIMYSTPLDTSRGNKNSWWTRTSDISTKVNVGSEVSTDYRYPKGYYRNEGALQFQSGDKNNAYGIRPAFYLNKDKVLLSSAAAGGKSVAGMESGLTAVGVNATDDWKLTLKDDARDAFTVTGVNWAGATVTFNYSDATTGTNEYLSAVIVNNGNVTHYGRFWQLDGTTHSDTGNATLTIPPSVALDSNTKLYVFNEQYNGNNKTDYASRLIEVRTTDFPAAAISDVTVSGQTFSPIAAQDATITLTNATFSALSAGTDVSGWFTNRPTGLAAKIKTAVAQDDTTATVTFSGTPSATSAAAMTVAIPAGSLAGGVSLSAYNANAKWSIVEGVTVATPTFSPPAGTYAMAQNVTLSCATSGATIRYTTNGNDPDESSSIYSAPIPTAAAGTTTIKARAYAPGQIASAVALATYTVTATVSPAADTTVTRVIGQKASLAVTASHSAGNVSYQWWINRGSGFTMISGATGSTYETSLLTLANDGFQYYCAVTDDSGTVKSGTFLLRVTPYTPAAGQRAIYLNTGGLKDPVISANAYDYVYFGVDDGGAIQWLVLDADKGNATGASDSLRNGAGTAVGNSGAMFLYTNRLIDYVGAVNYKMSYFANDNNVYQNSDLKKLLEIESGNVLETKFSASERDALLHTTKSDSYYRVSSIGTFAASTNILNGDRLFPLSAEELNTYVADGSRTPPTQSMGFPIYWLRSPHYTDSKYAGVYRKSEYSSTNFITTVEVNSERAFRIACNLNKSAVLFSSAAVGGKYGKGGLQPVGANDGNEWRLTLLDKANHGTFAVTVQPATVPATGGQVIVPFSGANAGQNEFLSAMLVDAAGNALYYGRLRNLQYSGSSGTQTVDIPALPAGRYTLKVFNEQFNGGQHDDMRLTDYASAFWDIPLTVTAAEDPDGGEGGAGEADVPKTGDNATPWLWAGLLLAAGAALAVNFALRRRKRKAQNHS